MAFDGMLIVFIITKMKKKHSKTDYQTSYLIEYIRRIFKNFDSFKDRE